MKERDLKEWTKELAVEAVNLVQQLPKNTEAFVYGKQLIRSTSSVGANYRAACRGRSDSEMLAKFGTVEEEADESQYWLELLVAAGLAKSDQIAALHKSYGEVVAIMVASRRTLRKRLETDGNTGR